MSNQTKSVLLEVWDERCRQDNKWGEQNHPDFPTGYDFQTAALRSDHFKLECEQYFSTHNPNHMCILEEEFCEALAESDPIKLRAELVQVAAVAVAWIECIDRRKR